VVLPITRLHVNVPTAASDERLASAVDPPSRTGLPEPALPAAPLELAPLATPLFPETAPVAAWSPLAPLPPPLLAAPVLVPALPAATPLVVPDEPAVPVALPLVVEPDALDELSVVLEQAPRPRAPTPSATIPSDVISFFAMRIAPW
jgi:hypothetical protein